jgi:hypothetical protein
MKRSRYTLYHFLFWLVVTLLFLYDRRYLTQKLNLPHFIECITVRLGLLIGLAYFNLRVLIPRFLPQGKFRYGLSLIGCILIYTLVQNAYDIYLFGYVIGDSNHKNFWWKLPYNFFSSLWYVFIMATVGLALDWFEQRDEVTRLEQEIERLKLQEAPMPSREDVNGKEIILKTGTKRVKVELSSITHIQGLKDYSVIFSGAEKIIVKGSLKNVEELFPAAHFVRVHKSFLVASTHLKNRQANSIIINSLEIPIGRAFRQQVEKAFSS